MAGGGGNAKDKGPRLYDPRSDASWQARLDEARAKRERVLREREATKKPKKRLKPWEEEGAIVLDDDVNFSPEQTGVEFSARVDAMRSIPGAKSESSALLIPDDTSPTDEDDPDSGSLTVSETPRPSLTVVPKPPVNRVISDPYASSNAFDPFEEAERETIPIEELYAGPPDPVRPSRVVRVEPEVDLSSLRPKSALKKFTKRTRSSPWTVVAIFAAAIAVGPLYQMLRPIERGPLVYTLSAFPTEPAFGLTTPMFNQPMPTQSGEWVPVVISDVATLPTVVPSQQPPSVPTLDPLPASGSETASTDP